MAIKSSRRNRRQIPNSLAAVTAPVVDLWNVAEQDPANPTQIPVILYQVATTPEGAPATLPIDPNTWLIGLTPEIGYVTADTATFVPAIGTILTTVGTQEALAFVFEDPVPNDASLIIPSWSDSLRSLTGAWLAGGVQRTRMRRIGLGFRELDPDNPVITPFQMNIVISNIFTGIPAQLTQVCRECIRVNEVRPLFVEPVGPIPTGKWQITMENPIGEPGTPVQLQIEYPCNCIYDEDLGIIAPMNQVIGEVVD